MPYHLLLPLTASVVFVVGMMLVKVAISRGASVWTGIFLGNLWIALIWGVAALCLQDISPPMSWPYALVVGSLFLIGQLLTYLAFQRGDVSVATPVMGVKVLFVALLTSLSGSGIVSVRVWYAAALASGGIALVQFSGRRMQDGKTLLSIFLAITAAFALSLFDVLLQSWAPRWGGASFLPPVFAATGLLSCVLLPWVDRPNVLLQNRAASFVLGGTLLMGLQALCMSTALGVFGDAARVNIVYAMRGLWSVLIAWGLARWVTGNELHLDSRVMVARMIGSALLTVAVVLAISA